MRATSKADYDRMEVWLLSQYRISTMISGCGKPYHIAFFNRQRSILENLFDGTGGIKKIEVQSAYIVYPLKEYLKKIPINPDW